MNMDDRKRRLIQEKTLFRYIAALESGDIDTLADILHTAESDPELERMILEHHAAQPEVLPMQVQRASPNGKLKEETDPMTVIHTFRQKAPPQRPQFPLTLAAAVLMLVLFGGVLLFAAGGPPSEPTAGSGPPALPEQSETTPEAAPELPPAISADNAERVALVLNMERDFLLGPIAWSPDGELLAAAHAEGVLLYDNATFMLALSLRAEALRLEDTLHTVTSLLLTPTMVPPADWTPQSEVTALLLTPTTLPPTLPPPPAGQTGGTPMADPTAPPVTATPVGSTPVVVLPSATPVGWTVESGTEAAVPVITATPVGGWTPGGPTAVPWTVEAGHAGIPAAMPRLLELENPPLLGMRFSPDSALLAVLDNSEVVRLYRVADGSQQAALAGHEGRVWGVAFSPDGALAATAGQDRSVRLWDVASGEELRLLTGHNGQVTALAFSPDGAVLASASGDVRLWDVESGRQIAAFSISGIVVAAITDMAFSPDGAVIATLQGPRIRLWDVASGEALLVIEDDSATRHPNRLAYSPDGSVLAVVRHDVVQLWDSSTGDLLAVLEGNGRRIDSLAFSPDGTTLAFSVPLVRSGGLWFWAVGPER